MGNKQHTRCMAVRLPTAARVVVQQLCGLVEQLLLLML